MSGTGRAKKITAHTDKILSLERLVEALEGGRPINPQGDRALLLAGLASIDYVTFFDQDTPLELIMAVKPDVLVKGGDWTVENIVGHEFVLERGGEVYSLPFKEGYSTTRLIDKIKKLSDPPEKGRAS